MGLTFTRLGEGVEEGGQRTVGRASEVSLVVEVSGETSEALLAGGAEASETAKRTGLAHSIREVTVEARGAS